MAIANILKDHSLSNTRSLVLVAVTENEFTQTYITIVDHSSSGSLIFSATEMVTTAQEQETVWLRRTMFNGRYADIVVNQKRAAVLNSRSIKLNKTIEPDFKLPQRNIIG